MPWSNPGFLLEGQIIIDGTSDQLLVYSGAPAAGNLILAISTVKGTDKFGNVFYAGLTVYEPNIPGALGDITFYIPQSGNSSPFIEGFHDTFSGDNVLLISPPSQVTNMYMSDGAGGTSGGGVSFGAGPTGKYYHEEVTWSMPAFSGTGIPVNLALVSAQSASDYAGSQFGNEFWTCPASGPYIHSADVNLSGTAAEWAGKEFFIEFSVNNGVILIRSPNAEMANVPISQAISYCKWFNKGDVVNLGVFNGSTVAQTATGNWTVHRLGF